MRFGAQADVRVGQTRNDLCTPLEPQQRRTGKAQSNVLTLTSEGAQRSGRCWMLRLRRLPWLRLTPPIARLSDTFFSKRMRSFATDAILHNNSIERQWASIFRKERRKNCPSLGRRLQISWTFARIIFSALLHDYRDIFIAQDLSSVIYEQKSRRRKEYLKDAYLFENSRKMIPRAEMHDAGMRWIGSHGGRIE